MEKAYGTEFLHIPINSQIFNTEKLPTIVMPNDTLKLTFQTYYFVFMCINSASRYRQLFLGLNIN